VNSSTIRIGIRTHARRALFALACLALAGFYMSLALRAFRADRLASRLDASRLQEAVRWEPLNAAYHHALGRHASLVEQDAPAAIAHYRQAIALNPYSARLWLDLAMVYQFSGDAGGEREALHRAVEVDPTTPDIAWEVANFYLVRDDVPAALRYFRVVIENDPASRERALRLCWRATQDVNRILPILPPMVDAYVDFLRVLQEHKQTSATESVWAQMLALRKPFSAKLSFPYLDYLLEEHRVDTAVQNWKQLAPIDRSVSALQLSGENLVTNGGFEEDILNGGFDWRKLEIEHARAEADSSVFHSGSRSLAISFDGKEVGPGLGVTQLVPVKPNAKYEFSGYMKADTIESGSGPRFSISDRYSSGRLVLTEDVLGTAGWQQRTATFTTGPQTNLLVVQVVRDPSWMLIKGRVWIDDLSLTAK
jgi:hypothetical protein